MLFRNATLADGRQRDVRVEDSEARSASERASGDEPRAGTIEAVQRDLDRGADEDLIDATGKRLLPGMIDAHVHFRQPGASHKETWHAGSRAAAAGGVTTVVDQPNTDPPTIDGTAFDEKREIAADDSIVDYGINGGVTEEWIPNVLLRRSLFALGEVFLADSTGEMGIDADLFAEALAAATERDVTVTVHAEDESLFNPGVKERDDADAWSAYRAARAEVNAVERACQVARAHDARIHVAHTSTPGGIDAASAAGMTCEVTPHHMLLSRSDYDRLGTHGRMNPPLRRESLRRRVYERVADGTVDMIATDHAPHTIEEKDQSIWDAPSGVPGVETALPLLLAEVQDGNLTYERVRDLTAANPAAVFDLPNKGAVAPGKDADLVLVDGTKTTKIDADDLHTSCGWTPFDGFEGAFPELTMVRGTVVYERDPETGEGQFHPNRGENVRSAERSADRSDTAE